MIIGTTDPRLIPGHWANALECTGCSCTVTADHEPGSPDCDANRLERFRSRTNED